MTICQIAIQIKLTDNAAVNIRSFIWEEKLHMKEFGRMAKFTDYMISHICMYDITYMIK